ncbi:hypothetical protein BpHYR1_002267 [Brachionus plicatilis]|uniref:Uncharacterized protein n=1 Tax=Brachionus plicatilis TaxID=10195 RepID=A0A3M7SLT9_BRAPC|nr:hypothetical protein BpHYR1_002267 [Brachionus plicatilis]
MLKIHRNIMYQRSELDYFQNDEILKKHDKIMGLNFNFQILLSPRKFVPKSLDKMIPIEKTLPNNNDKIL